MANTPILKKRVSKRPFIALGDYGNLCLDKSTPLLGLNRDRIVGSVDQYLLRQLGNCRSIQSDRRYIIRVVGAIYPPRRTIRKWYSMAIASSTITILHSLLIY